jgi:uncharacterized protein (DUF1810 family)
MPPRATRPRAIPAPTLSKFSLKIEQMADLGRFVEAQGNGVYDRALAELRAGQKRSHWMWFVFPQIAGLGRSETAQFYAIEDIAEARAYLQHPMLGPRLVECTEALLDWDGRRPAEAILGLVDAMKLKSSLTLFEALSNAASPFPRAIEAFFGGERDAATLDHLG